MATLDTIAGYTSVISGGRLHLIGHGSPITVGTGVRLAFVGGTGNDTITATLENGSTPNAYVGWTIVQTGTTTITYVLHPAGSDGNPANRISNQLTLSWSPGGTTPIYATPAVLAPPIVGSGKVLLQWAAAVEADPRVSRITYRVMRSTSGPTSGFGTRASGVNALYYLDTGTNGTNYWYRIDATVFYADDTIETPQVGIGHPSNVVGPVVMVAAKTYLGALVTR